MPQPPTSRTERASLAPWPQAVACGVSGPHVVAVAISKVKGVKKSPVPQIILRKGLGVVGDSHAGPGIRQVSLLAQESIETMRRKGATVGPGDFAENITTSGLKLPTLPLGARLRLGKTALLQITQIGKECHAPCQIYYSAGDCVMPREGVFAIVIRGGKLRPGDPVRPVGSIRAVPGQQSVLTLPSNNQPPTTNNRP